MPTSRTVLALTYWPLRSGLVQAYTLPYLRQILDVLGPSGRVIFVTQDPPEGPLAPSESDAWTLPDRVDWVSFTYRPFGASAVAAQLVNVVALFRRCVREDVDVIHCFCSPAGAFGWLLSVLTGCPLVLDSYEPHAEAMVESGTWGAGSLRARFLSLLERLQSRRAAAVVAVTESMRQYASARYGVIFDAFFVKPACVDLIRFDPERVDGARLRMELGLDGKIVCLYSGKFGGMYLDTEVFAWMRAAQERWGDRFRALVLSSDPPDRLRRLSAEAGFDASALIVRYVEHHDVPRHLAVGDFAITPVRPLPCKRHCAPIKDGEYWAMGLPVVIPPDISDDSDIISREKIGVVLADVSKASFAAALGTLEAMGLSQPSADERRRIRGVAIRERSFERSAAVYRQLYGALISP